jgi:5-methylcytosine-specific restriction endonuclease McrA
MLIRKEDNFVVDSSLPLVLALNAGGEALRWISYQDSAYYASKGAVLWSTGTYSVLLRGGTNVLSGKQSTLNIDTIIALNSKVSPTKFRKAIPTLSNKQLFARDRNLCAYCGLVYPSRQLTCDHILPKSHGGLYTWSNVVTACRNCNQRKDDMTPEQARMKLLYVPYVPSYNETLILKNRRILQDQMEFLLKGVSDKSRLHDMINAGEFIDDEELIELD